MANVKIPMISAADGPTMAARRIFPVNRSASTITTPCSTSSVYPRSMSAIVHGVATSTRLGQRVDLVDGHPDRRDLGAAEDGVGERTRCAELGEVGERDRSNRPSPDRVRTVGRQRVAGDVADGVDPLDVGSAERVGDDARAWCTRRRLRRARDRRAWVGDRPPAAPCRRRRSSGRRRGVRWSRRSARSTSR